MADMVFSGVTFSGGYSIELPPPPAYKAIFGYGYNGATRVSMTNLVSNTGIVAADTTGVGTARYALAAAGYAST